MIRAETCGTSQRHILLAVISENARQGSSENARCGGGRDNLSSSANTMGSVARPRRQPLSAFGFRKIRARPRFAQE